MVLLLLLILLLLLFSFVSSWFSITISNSGSFVSTRSDYADYTIIVQWQYNITYYTSNTRWRWRTTVIDVGASLKIISIPSATGNLLTLPFCFHLFLFCSFFHFWGKKSTTIKLRTPCYTLHSLFIHRPQIIHSL